MDSPPKFSETLDFIVQFLRAEGFYAAESALVREIENRCPDGDSPTASPANNQLFAPSPGGQRESPGPPGFRQQDTDALSEKSERQSPGVEDWRSRDDKAGSGSDESPRQRVSYLSPEAGSFLSSILSRTYMPGDEPRLEQTDDDVDEYDDDNDPGYVREQIRGQDAFIEREIELSDEDASQRGLKLYHEARAQQSQWDQSQQGDDDGGASSDGNGSSYFSGEVIERRNSNTLSQVSVSDRAGNDDEPKVVTLMDPVNPKPRSASSTVSPSKEEADEEGLESHPLSHISSDCGTESTLYHEPSLGTAQGLTDTASSAEREGEEGETRGWSGSYLNAFGVLGRVFGRSESRMDSPSQQSSDQQQSSRQGQASSKRPGNPQGVADLQPAINDKGSREGSDTESSRVPGTPQQGGKAGDNDSAFSFPVTPPSEPPAAVAPGAVFGSWHSTKAGSRKREGKGDLNSRASSEYAASGYSTDEGQNTWNNDGVGSESAVGEGRSAKAPSDTTMDSASQTPEPKRQEGGAATGVVTKSGYTSMSLPGKPGLASATPEEGSLQAYKPTPGGTTAEGTEATTQRSGELTERTMETALAADDSTAGGGADDYSSVHYCWDEEFVHEKYEIINLKIIHRRHRTGFEECKDIAIHVNDLIAGRYQVTDFLGSAAFSQAVQAVDIKTGSLVCLKIIKNNKDYLDQSLDEIKLLKYVNDQDPNSEHGILQLYDYFYYKEHLFLVCELLRANLYEFQKYNREHGQEPYFTLQRVQSIARQVLRSLAFMHSLDLIHCDLKPENILIKSYSRCEVKVIDLGSSCFVSDHLSSYVQSRSYRAPEVILGLPYHQQVDVWSLGCILAELLSGYVLFQNDSLATLLARVEGILGPIPRWMLSNGRYAHRYYTRTGMLFEQSQTTGRYELLRPKRTSMKFRVPEADQGCLEFLNALLTVDPKKRPTAVQALQHPWLQYDYSSISAGV